MDGPEPDGSAVPLGPAADIPDGATVVVPGARLGTDVAVAVFNDGGRLYAVDDACTHERASLADGWVEDGTVECPLHGGVFCLRTGSVLAGPPQRPATTHRVEARAGTVWLVPTRNR